MRKRCRFFYVRKFAILAQTEDEMAADADGSFKIPTARQYEAQIGVTTKNREQVIKAFRLMMRRLRQIAKYNGKVACEMGIKLRPICGTCAFGPNIRRQKGFLATSHGVMAALVEPKIQFMCHDNQPAHESNLIERRRLIYCSGYRLTEIDETARQAAEDRQE